MDGVPFGTHTRVSSEAIRNTRIAYPRSPRAIRYQFSPGKALTEFRSTIAANLLHSLLLPKQQKWVVPTLAVSWE